jgi:hypothetical protein
MADFSFDASRGRKGIQPPSKNWMAWGSLVMAIVIVMVLYDFSDLKGKMDGFLPNGYSLKGKAAADEKIASSENESTEEGKDIFVTEKDLQKLYKEMLRKKEKEIEKVTIYEPEKGVVYRIDLVTGKSLAAVTIQMDKKTAIITDQQGMVISIDKEEIAGIKKIDLKTDGQQDK